VFATCAGLRLARFNVAIEDPNRPAWAANYFVGMPAPAGAITVLLPIYLAFLAVPVPSIATFLYTLAIAILMVSRLPVYSGKKLGTRVPRELVLPVFMLAVLFFALLISYPWPVLALGTLAYLAALPFGWLSYRRLEQAADEPAAAEASPQPEHPAPPHRDRDGGRPARLN
jgi:CDP-diacylglycerol--serine O-phosphatidyltransferase